MREPMPELKPRHAELSDASGLFTEPTAAAFRTNPLQQFWREHLLAQSMIDHGLYDEGYFVTIAPTTSRTPPKPIRRSCASPRTARSASSISRWKTPSNPAQRPGACGSLNHRYCDFWLVDGELELNAPTFGLARPHKRQRRKPANPG
jgi:hypothetical protein